MLKRLLSYVLIILAALSVHGAVMAQDGYDDSIPGTVKGKVLEVLDEKVEEIEYSGGSFEDRSQILEVKVTSGIHKGSIIEARHSLVGIGAYQGAKLKAGDGVLMFLELSVDGVVQGAQVTDILREKHLAWVAVSFLLLLLIIGRLKGLKAIIGLAVTIFAVLKIMLPLLLKGYSPIFVSVGVCALASVITLVLISGFSNKTLAAVAGTAGGLVIAGIIAYFVGVAIKLTGMGSEEAQMLWYVPSGTEFDFQGLLFAGIITGALGAVMDVGMSVASAINEVKINNPDVPARELIRAGMNVGRDIMGTMSNTLILAYTGGALNFMLLMMAYQVPFYEIINTDMLASEVLRALAGSIGLVFTVPVTAVAAGVIEKLKNTGDVPVDYRF